jgi:hypothetical protein
MKMCGGEWRYSCIFYLGTRWRWVASFTLRPLYPSGNSLSTHCIGGWAPEPVWTLRESNPAVHPIAHCYTDWTILAHRLSECSSDSYFHYNEMLCSVNISSSPSQSPIYTMYNLPIFSTFQFSARHIWPSRTSYSMWHNCGQNNIHIFYVPEIFPIQQLSLASDVT